MFISYLSHKVTKKAFLSCLICYFSPHLIAKVHVTVYRKKVTFLGRDTASILFIHQYCNSERTYEHQ